MKKDKIKKKYSLSSSLFYSMMLLALSFSCCNDKDKSTDSKSVEHEKINEKSTQTDEIFFSSYLIPEG